MSPITIQVLRPYSGEAGAASLTCRYRCRSCRRCSRCCLHRDRTNRCSVTIAGGVPPARPHTSSFGRNALGPHPVLTTGSRMDRPHRSEPPRTSWKPSRSPCLRPSRGSCTLPPRAVRPEARPNATYAWPACNSNWWGERSGPSSRSTSASPYHTAARRPWSTTCERWSRPAE